MPELLRMPEVAAGASEAVLSSWPLAVDTPFQVGDTIATIETAKASVDVAAETDGVLLALLVGEGSEVSIGAPIALLGAAGERVADVAAALAELGVEYGAPKPGSAASRSAPPVAPVGSADSAAGVTAPGDAGRIFVSPLARRLARAGGLALAEITGTGPNRRIVRRDVESALARHADADADRQRVARDAPTGPQPQAAFTDRPHSRLRKAIAARLLESKQSAPHFYLRSVVRVDALLRLRTELNEAGPVRISLTDLLVRAVGQAHLRVPEMNVIWTAEAVRSFTSVDVAVAVATEAGLLTPVLRDVDATSVTVIARTMRDLVDRARGGTLQQRELEGGSITVTNLGMFGTEEFAAIINPPQAAILAVGAVKQEPVVHDGDVVAGSVMRLTLSVDHRPVDGVTAARWMQALVALIERPIQLLS